MRLFSLISALSIALVAAQLNSAQHAALMEVYNATGCSTTDCPRFAANQPCNGSVLSCTGANVVSLFINGRGLTGTVPSVVGQLTALQYLTLDDNSLAGTLPSAMGRLTALTTLSLHSNARLVGTVPSTFSLLSNLSVVFLAFTQLTGRFPPTTAPFGSCDFRSTFLNCSAKPKASCLCSARLLGDDCENRLPISNVAMGVSTSSATTCVGCGSCMMQNDIWREWTASCTGNATISTCGFAPINTMLGIYRGACPSSSTPTATTESGSEDCNDFGSCGGNGRQEQATLAVASGERIIIRLGTTNSSNTVTGTLSISCSEVTTTAPAATTAAAAGPTTPVLSTSVGATAPALGASDGPTNTAPTTSIATTGTTAIANTTATPPTNASISATAPAATPSGPDVGLIAGVVGGIAALLLVVGVVAVVVWRRRRSTATPSGTAMTPQPSSHYASTSAAFRPDDAPHYDRLTPGEAAASHYAATGADFKPKDVAHYDRLAPQN